MQLKSNGAYALEIQATLEEDLRSTATEDLSDQEAYVVVDPRSVTLYAHAPEGSARNVLRGEITQILRTGAVGHEGGSQSGAVRINMQVASLPLPLIAEITEASAERMELSEGREVYASFKAREARAYL